VLMMLLRTYISPPAEEDTRTVLRTKASGSQVSLNLSDKSAALPRRYTDANTPLLSPQPTRDKLLHLRSSLLSSCAAVGDCEAGEEADALVSSLPLRSGSPLARHNYVMRPPPPGGTQQ
jgi:hypothetical protein